MTDTTLSIREIRDAVTTAQVLLVETRVRAIEARQRGEGIPEADELVRLAVIVARRAESALTRAEHEADAARTAEAVAAREHARRAEQRARIEAAIRAALAAAGEGLTRSALAASAQAPHGAV